MKNIIILNTINIFLNYNNTNINIKLLYSIIKLKSNSQYLNLTSIT